MATIIGRLRRQKLNTEEEFVALAGDLEKLIMKDIKEIARSLKVKLLPRKGELIARLISMSRLGSLPDENPSIESVEGGLSYMTDDVREALASLPSFSSCKDGWVKTVDGALDAFHFVHLHAYLVESRDSTFDAESMRAFKSLKGFKFFKDDFVRNIWIQQFPEKNIAFVRAFVFHSLTVETPLSVYVAFNTSSGEVYKAQCNCVSGAGAACSHIAALLFAMDKFQRDEVQELPREASKTSLPMQWHQPPKKVVKAALVSDLHFVSHTYDPSKERGDAPVGSVQLSKVTYDPRALPDRNMDRERLQVLLAATEESLPGSGLLTFWDEVTSTARSESEPESLLTALSGTAVGDLILFAPKSPLSSMSAACVSTEELTSAMCDRYAAEQTLTSDIVARVERSTRGQADNQIWWLLRNGRVTSSRFAEIKRRRSNTDPKRIVVDLMGYSKGGRTGMTAAMKWGRDNEDAARKAYVALSRLRNPDVTVQSCGLHLLPRYSFIGASSDGLVLGEESPGCLEIKCPYSVEGTVVRHLNPKAIAALTNKFCLKCDVNGDLVLDRGHPYFDQVQGEMGVMNVPWCDFVIFTAASTDAVHIERIQFDTAYWHGVLLPKLLAFYSSCVIPEILTRQYLTELMAQTATPLPTAKQAQTPTPAPSSAGIPQTSIPLPTAKQAQTPTPAPSSDGMVKRYLQRDQCQSRIQGRDGSNACTVIASAVVLAILEERIPLPTSMAIADSTVDAFVGCIIKGNQLYEGNVASEEGHLLGVYDAIDLFKDPGLRVMAHSDHGMRNEVDAVAVFKKVSTRAVEAGHPFAGVLVQTPLSLAIVFTPQPAVLIFDSHAHGEKGALIVDLGPGMPWPAVVSHVQNLIVKLSDAHLCLLEIRQ